LQVSMIVWMLLVGSEHMCIELLVANEHEQLSMIVWMECIELLVANEHEQLSMIVWMDVHRATSCK
jgi:hypothetical protein